ncbi:MAG: hypothetical protein JJE34_08875 [Alphaproteobacteria bacterium]|nr:hypothetical protein [Alphaproteobacteria bacterium]
MNVTVNVECTPEEARTFLGLPDVSLIHEKYIQTMMETMNGSNSVEQMEKMFSNFSPMMGDAGMRLFQQMMNIGVGGSGGTDKSGK